MKKTCTFKGVLVEICSCNIDGHIIILQVSSDLSIVDLDVPFSFIFSMSATMNACGNLGVLAVVTWQVLFVSIPMIYLTFRLQVNLWSV